MCGITGFCDFSKRSNKEVLTKMTGALSHRGPDDSGTEFFSLEECVIGLGHRRLSIIDLSPLGHQPMYSEGGNAIIAFNGEIYNYNEIRKRLIYLGYTFNSHSDTEVILKAFDKWGHDAVRQFIGMFSFSLFDKRAGKMFIYRDRAGVKPLFYYWHEGLLLFASELKSFHHHHGFRREINMGSLALFMQYGYIPYPYSIFNYTWKLDPGNYLELDIKNKKLEKRNYWNVYDFYNRPKLNLSPEESIIETEKLLRSACDYRMVADVPVGVFLSGGYDSTVVTALLQHGRTNKIKTFTIGFHEQEFNEAVHAKEIAGFLGTDHTEYYCTQKDAAEIIPLLPGIYDEPFGDSSAIPTILVSKVARSEVKVALSADAGDEIFAGYGKYDTVLKYHNLFHKMPWYLKKPGWLMLNMVPPKGIPYYRNQYNFETRYEKGKELLRASNPVEMLKSVSEHFTKNELNKIFINNIPVCPSSFDDYSKLLSNNSDGLNEILAIDYRTYLVDDILVKVDRATMSVNLEGREPLLDHRIIEYVAQLPSSLKYRNGVKKWLLKSIVHKYVPKELVDRPKMGFGVPIIDWCKNELKIYFEHYLTRERLNREGFFKTDEIMKLKEDYFNNRPVNINKLWLILMFEMWYEKWMC